MTDWTQVWELVVALLSAFAVGLGYWVRKLRTDVEKAKADGEEGVKHFTELFTAMNDTFAFVKKMNADKNFTQEAFDVLMDKITELMTKGQEAIESAKALVQDGKVIGDDISNIIAVLGQIKTASSSGSALEIASKLGGIKYNIKAGG
jgi:hypothetical protein